MKAQQLSESVLNQLHKLKEEMEMSEGMAEAPNNMLKECNDIYNTLRDVEHTLIEVVGPGTNEIEEKCTEAIGLISSVRITLHCMQQTATRLFVLAERIKDELY